MQQYKCKNCGNKFESDDGINSFCPDCGSYDVVATSNIKKISGLIAAGLCAAVVGFGLTSLFHNGNNDAVIGGGGGTYERETPTEESIGERDQSDESSSNNDELNSQSDSKNNLNDLVKEAQKKNEDNAPATSSSAMTVHSSTPKATSSGTYSFTVKATGVPTGAVVSYALLNSSGRQIATSKSGLFAGVRPDPSGHCIVRATATQKGKVVATATDYVYGLGKTDKPTTDTKDEEKTKDSRKLSSSEVNSLFKTGALRNASTHPLIASNVSVSCSGLKPGDSASSIADVYYIQKLRKADATVVGVGYDSKNKVNSIRFQVTYHSDDD